MNLNQIIQGDALETLRDLPDGSFAAVVTSPPYNGGITNPAGKAGQGDGRKRRWKGEYEGFNDAMALVEYVQYHEDILKALLRVLRPDGLLWYVHRRRPRATPDGLGRLLDDVLDPFLRYRRSEIIWDKGSPGAGFCHDGKGGAYYPTPAYETIFLLAKGKGAKLVGAEAAAGDIWRIPREKNEHPASFPVELAARCLRSTLAQGPVLDPFMGSGTTALAAQMTGRDWLGIELSLKYIRQAQARLSEPQLTLPA